MTNYAYSDGRLLEDPHTYFFSHTGGNSFLKAYLESRAVAIRYLTNQLSLEKIGQDSANNWLLAEWRRWIQQGCEDPVPGCILTFMKRFAVTKKVWTDYSLEVRPSPNARNDDFTFYCIMSNLCLDVVTAKADLRFINITLQINDILIAYQQELTEAQAALALMSILGEVNQVMKLLSLGQS